jgi:hypothetical protein
MKRNGMTLTQRAEAAQAAAYQEARACGLDDQAALEVGRYAANLVRTGCSAHRAIVLGRDRSSRSIVAAAIRRAAKYARVRLGNEAWGSL